MVAPYMEDVSVRLVRVDSRARYETSTSQDRVLLYGIASCVHTISIPYQQSCRSVFVGRMVDVQL